MGSQRRVRTFLEPHRRGLCPLISQTMDDVGSQTRIPSMRTFAATLQLHQDNILSFIQRPLTNAVGEGLNRIIKIVKNRASGFRNLEAFTDLIYLTVGDFDILAHIPSRLRSL